MNHLPRPCRGLKRPRPRHAIVSLNDAPPAELIPALIVLAGVTTADEARDVLDLVPPADKPRLVTWMVGRRTFRTEALHAVVTSMPRSELRQAVGPERAGNLLRLYGDGAASSDAAKLDARCRAK